MWLYVPNISVYSQEPEVLTSPSKSLCQSLAVSATSRGKLKQPKSWRRVLETRLSTTRLSGLTSAPSMVDRGVVAWMESLEVSPVRTSPLLESEEVSSATIAVDSSTSTPGSLGKCNLNGSISKTYQQSSLFQQEELFSENLPPWGSMRSGELFERPTWVPSIDANGAGYWPTSAATDGERAGRGITEGMSGTSLTQVVNGLPKMWPTALAGDALKSGPGQARMWTTPQAHDSGKGNAVRVGRFATEHGGRNLADDVMLWRTPDAMQCGGAQSAQKRLEGGHALRLQDQVQNWGTPTTRDWKDGDSSQADVPTNGLLGRQAAEWSSLPDRQTPSGTTCWCGTTGCVLRSHKRKLNPLFVEMLMGWPLHYTNVSIVLEPAVMELYLYRVRLLLESLCGEST